MRGTYGATGTNTLIFAKDKKIQFDGMRKTSASRRCGGGMVCGPRMNEECERRGAG